MKTLMIWILVILFGVGLLQSPILTIQWTLSTGFILVILWVLLLTFKWAFLGIWLVPLRQNQYLVIEKKGDESKSAAGGGNFRRYVGYSIRMKNKKPTYYIINENKVVKEIPKKELGNYYPWFWRFIGAYPALTWGIDRIKTYKFSWGKITNQSDKEIDEKKDQIVDSFFDSYTYGIEIKNLVTLDLQRFTLKVRLPVVLENIHTACYENLPTGTWLNQYTAQLFEGAKSYFGSINSKDILKMDFKRGGAEDLIDHFFENGYIKAAAKKSGYKLAPNEEIGVMDIVGLLSGAMQEAQEAKAVETMKGKGVIAKAAAKRQADIKQADGEKALKKAALQSEMEAFFEKLPDEIKSKPELASEMWKSYQISKLGNLQALNTEVRVMKELNP